MHRPEGAEDPPEWHNSILLGCRNRTMNRREFLVAVGVASAFSSAGAFRYALASDEKSLTVHDAYSLWYNRPAVAEIARGGCLGFVSSSGDVQVSGFDVKLSKGVTRKLHSFEDASDHGSPSLLRVPSGQYAGHIIACFSNHASPLFFCRSSRPEDVSDWTSPRVIDEGRSTYVSLAALPDGKILLMHTLQERKGKHSSGEWRKVVARTSEDGGDSWGPAVQIAGLGPGTFPYSTPLVMSMDGLCAMTYAIYSAVQKRHQGLTVVITKDAFYTKVEIPIDLGTASDVDTVPFETKWVSDTLVAVSYTEVSGDGLRGVSRVVMVNVQSGESVSNVIVDNVAVHAYAGGAALSGDGRSVVYSPASSGGLVRKNLFTGAVEKMINGGEFSSPGVVAFHGRSLVVALRDPLIQTTRKFSSSILIMDAGIGAPPPSND